MRASGAALFQRQDGKKVLLGYYSKSFTPTEAAYPIADRELLAVMQAVQHWSPELHGLPFTIVTDHEALKYFTTKKKLSARQVRWSEILSQFDYDFVYRPPRERRCRRVIPKNGGLAHGQGPRSGGTYLQHYPGGEGEGRVHSDREFLHIFN